VELHQKYVQERGEQPPVNDPSWCPKIDWSPDELFGEQRFNRYFDKWDDTLLKKPDPIQVLAREIYGDAYTPYQ
jgi:hypothetical protein